MKYDLKAIRQEQIDEIVKPVEKLLNDFDENLLKMAELIESNATKDEEIKKLLARIDDLKADREPLEANIKELSDKCGELMRENAALKAEIIEFKKQAEERAKKPNKGIYRGEQKKPYISPKSRFRIGEK